MTKIYESPDGGETVYERDTVTGKREKIIEPYVPEWHIDDHTLSNINELAERGNKSLQNALKELKLLYNLSKEEND